MRFFLCLFFFFCSSLYAENSITASSYLLIDKDSLQIIAARDYEKPLPPASTIKILTALIALEKLSGNEVIIPGKEVKTFPQSKLGLIPGKRYKSLDLIKAVLIGSANDAAYALSKYIAGNEEKFAHLMTEKAKTLGAKNTCVKNSTGLYIEDQYTTCLDLALILMGALENEKFREIIGMKNFSLVHGGKLLNLDNHNRFLFCFPPAIGGKTGFTRASKYTYVGAFERDGHTYILSILGSEDLWGDAKKILANIYDNLPDDEEIRLAKAKVKVTILNNEKKRKINYAALEKGVRKKDNNNKVRTVKKSISHNAKHSKD